MPQTFGEKCVMSNGSQKEFVMETTTFSLQTNYVSVRVFFKSTVHTQVKSVEAYSVSSGTNVTVTAAIKLI